MPASRRLKFLWLAGVLLCLFAAYMLIRLPDTVYPAYCYETADQGFLFIESPGKGAEYQMAQDEFGRYRQWRGNPTMVLYRTTKPDYSNPWAWYDIATHPRWKLPYMAPSPKDGDYWETIRNNQQAMWEYQQGSP